MGKKIKLKLAPAMRQGKAQRPESLELFCQEYVVDRNASRAARAAGYSEHTAAEQGCRLLRKVHVKKRIGDLLAERYASIKMSAEEAMLVIQRTGMYDPRRIFDENANVLPPAQWPDDIACAIAGFEVREIYHPVTGRKTGYVKKVKWKDALRANEDIAKHLGALKDGAAINISAPTTVVSEEQLKEVDKKLDSDC